MRPLRQAWAEDSVGQEMSGQNGPATKHGRLASLILRLGVAAAVIGGLVEISIVSRQWKNARATIQANAVPLADPPTLPAATLPPPVEISERDSGDVPANQVAEAEPPRPVEISPPESMLLRHPNRRQIRAMASISSTALRCRPTREKPSPFTNNRFGHLYMISFLVIISGTNRSGSSGWRQEAWPLC